jgi:hypothetical protein
VALAQQLREFAVGSCVAAYLLFSFFFQYLGRDNPPEQRIELNLRRDAGPAAHVDVRLLLLRSQHTGSCDDDERYPGIFFEGVADGLGKVETRHVPSWNTRGTRREKSHDHLKRVRLCVRESGQVAWRPAWIAPASDVNHRELTISCNLGTTATVECSHRTSADYDKYVRIAVMAVNFLLFLILVTVGAEGGVGGAWVWLLVSVATNHASKVMGANDAFSGNLLLFAAVAMSIYAISRLRHVRVRERLTSKPSFSLKIFNRRNPF